MHDAAGNRLALTVRAVNETAEGWFREGWHNDTRYVFDRAGNLRQRRYTDGSRQDFVWDESQQLVAVHQGESVTHYAYDGLGRRIGKQTATESRWFYWQGDALLAEVAEPGASRCVRWRCTTWPVGCSERSGRRRSLTICGIRLLPRQLPAVRAADAAGGGTQQLPLSLRPERRAGAADRRTGRAGVVGAMRGLGRAGGGACRPGGQPAALPGAVL
ncbi:Uncharacterised protein [Serratia rubidaea]|uniref:Cell wall-associated polypeptide CWBP200 n=1 Tax=Serratia rubidaea TaxID=61652 RepID=A0A4U9HXR6_SERRU|nr:Uncharacterised protein [Serratia rubidaea]